MRCKIDMRGLSQLEKKLLKGVSKDKISQVVRLNTAELTQKAKDRAPVSTEKTNPGGAHGLEKKLLKGVSKDKISQVVRLNTAELTQKAKDRAPVSTEKTNPGGAHGQLKRSIIPSVGSGGLVGKVNATVDYAEYVEMGTRFMAAPSPT